MLSERELTSVFTSHCRLWDWGRLNNYFY